MHLICCNSHEKTSSNYRLLQMCLNNLNPKLDHDDVKKSFHFITTLDHNNYNSWEYKNSIEYNNLDACDLHEMVQC
jgi:hypothetical protein